MIEWDAPVLAPILDALHAVKVRHVAILVGLWFLFWIAEQIIDDWLRRREIDRGRGE